MIPAQYSQQTPDCLGSPEELLEEYFPLIRYHAGQLVRRTPDSVEMDDLIDSGVLGLLDGASRFDSRRGIQFKTFVSYRVRGAMIDYLRAFDWFPRTLRDTCKELQQALAVLEQKFGRSVEEQEVATHIGISLQEYRDRLTQVRGMSVVYFDDLPPIGQGEDALHIIDTISGDPELLPDRQVAMYEFADKLAGAIEKLPVREKILLTLYYYEELSMKEVALVLGLTESRISQMHSQMVLRLRGLLELDVPHD